MARNTLSRETYRLKRDLTGMKFGRLFVVSLAPRSCRGLHRTPRWICACSCGDIVTTPQTHSLMRGETVSCGCKSSENTSGYFTHGLSNSNLYSSWHAMRGRCNNRRNQDYDRYGGRGIKVCVSWEKSFVRFHN